MGSSHPAGTPPVVLGGTYGLGAEDLTPAHVAAVVRAAAAGQLAQRFEVGATLELCVPHACRGAAWSPSQVLTQPGSTINTKAGLFRWVPNFLPFQSR